MATTYTTLKNKNGVELREVILVSTGKTVCYEIYVDGDWYTKVANLRTATSLWKDFVG